MTTNIDYKGGKITWDTFKNIQWNDEHSLKYLSQDLLQVVYPHCTIDVGHYGEFGFGIYVIVYAGDKETPEDWAQPFAKIMCKEKEDLFIQLQRAIDLYPPMLKDYK